MLFKRLAKIISCECVGISARHPVEPHFHRHGPCPAASFEDELPEPLPWGTGPFATMIHNNNWYRSHLYRDREITCFTVCRYEMVPRFVNVCWFKRFRCLLIISLMKCRNSLLPLPYRSVKELTLVSKSAKSSCFSCTALEIYCCICCTWGI